MKKKFRKIFFTIDWVAVLLLLIGGINWGLVGLFNFNLVNSIFGGLSNIIYTIVGVLSVYVLGRWATKTYMKK